MVKLKKFGTFGGVFTPSILTILGVIMYMRLPMIAGESGLFGTLGIILIAHLISITTGLSVSSIATDKKVKEGGTYYIISRSLGLPIGGTLGLALFVGLSFSVSLYLIGFSESFLSYWELPMDINHIRITGSIILLVVTIITFISTSLAIKAQYLIMTAIFLSLLSIFFGHHDYTPVSPNFFGKGTGVPLIVLFGIFFPAVTGFEAGVSMSGDLKDPKRSIPLGTISAIAIGLVAYIGLAFFFAYTVDGEMLASDPRALFNIALVPQLVIAGIWGATLSSALGSILAAPRILQSTAIDKITNLFFAKGTGASKEPRNALLITFLIAEAGILIGELDVIARIVSIFFITTYGFLNLSAAFESLTSADFRPSFKTSPWISIIGSLACILVMIQLDFLAMIGAVIILGALYLFLKRRQLVLETGDTWSSVWFSLVRTGIRKLNRSAMHTRNWRPNIILFSGQDKTRPHLVEFARAFSGRFGLFSAFDMIESNKPELIKDKRYFSSFGTPDELIVHQHQCRDIYQGMDEIARVYGFTGIEPNTVLMGWSKNEKNKEKFLKLIRNFEKSDFNMAFLVYDFHKIFGNKKTIDLWWSGWGSNLTFSLFLLRHFTAEGDWKDAHIRLLIINNLKDPPDNIYKKLQDILNQFRVNVEIKLINNALDGLTKIEIISRESANTDLTFIGIPDKQFQHIDSTDAEVMTLSKSLGTFFMLNSSSGFESFDLGLELKHDDKKTYDIPQILQLPELKPSKYLIINEDINRIDINGQKVLTLFIEKTITPLFSEIENVTNNIQTAVKAAFNQLNKLESLDDTYRSKKALIKIKNDFYFRINRSFKELAETRLEMLKAKLDSGIKWYIKQLDQDLLKFPLKMKIPYEKEDLALKRNDAFRLKWFKLRRRMSHPFARKSIPGNIRYYEIAEYYLRNNRHLFLDVFLKKLQAELFEPLSGSRSLILSIDNMLDDLLRKSDKKKLLLQAIKEDQNDIEAKINELKAGIKDRRDKMSRRLMVEFRKNLQLMSNDMEKADINFRIRRKRRKRKFYTELVLKNSDFADAWYELTLQQLNKINMDVLLHSLQSRIKDKINELNLVIAQQLENSYRAELKEICLKLDNYNDKPEEIPGLRLSNQNFEDNITILRDFEQFGDEILKLTETLPESITIATSNASEIASDDGPGSLDVPLRKITRFYIESRFLGATHDQLEKEVQSLKTSIFMVQDLLNLTRFNLDNIPDDMVDKEQIVAPIIKGASQKILKESEKISEIRNSIYQLLEQAQQEVFNQLSAYRIPSTVSEYSYFIREQQGRKVLKTFDAYLERLGSLYKRLSAKLLYSRSEGILLAKKIMESEGVVSGNQKLLDLVEKVSPNEKVIDSLPQFYKNLFSGRSSISEDFWIPRKKDEESFLVAYRRYQAGYLGGIMVSGERNAGKTVFCKHICKKLASKDKIHHLFPLPKGSSLESDFIAELGKVTLTKGGIEEIMDSLPEGTILVIHDLELWWERAAEGWDVVRLLIRLINEYSKKIMFVVNTNPFSYELMNKVVDLKNSFIGIIPLMPFDSRELQEMIIRRHRSSGLKFVLNKKGEDELSEIKLARLFNRYFDYSEGNPGTALNAWKANIVRTSAERIFIQYPYLPDNRILADINEDWKVVLIEMILHKRLTIERIKKIFNSDDPRTVSMIRSLKRTGLIEERTEDIYMLNGFVGPNLIREFKREGLL